MALRAIAGLCASGVTSCIEYVCRCQLMSPATLLTLTMMIAHLHCSQWERMDDGTWRAEGNATIFLDGGGMLTVRRVDVAKNTDLDNTLEAFCRTDLDGGIGDDSDN